MMLCVAHAANGQAPQATSPSPTAANAADAAKRTVPITEEPHHHLIFANDYVRVFRVEILSPDSTLLHRHDFPYAYVSIGKAEFTNKVEGKPEVRVKLSDGQLGYSKGGFSHQVRTENDTPFYNVTVELLHPQENVRSSCAKNVNGPLEGCGMPQPAPAQDPLGTGNNTAVGQVAPDPANDASKNAAPPTIIQVLETDESTLKSASFPQKSKTILASPPGGTLLVVAPLSQFKLDFVDGTTKLISGGDSLWLAPGPPVSIANSSDQQRSNVLIFGFKDAPKAPAK